MAKNIRIEEVAQLAGVSISTVSRVINKLPSVSKKNRIKVEAVIKELGFRPHILAQRLASGKGASAVGLVIPRYEGVFYSFYALQLIRGIGSACDKNNLDLFLNVTGSESVTNFSSLCGVIFADIVGNRKYLESILALDIPCVVVNNMAEDLKVDSIAIDNKQAAKDVVSYFINLGHSNIAHITGDLNTQAASQRLEGYQEALQEKSLPINSDYIIQADYTRQKAREAAEKLLHIRPRPTAVFVASDSMAIEIMGIIFKQGLRIPEDLSIIGFDDNPEGLYASVSLTTVRQPLIKMGEMAVERIKAYATSEIKGTEKISLPCELVIRDSCRRL